MLESYAAIYQRASERKGGEKRLLSLISAPLSQSELATIGDDRYLAELTQKVFQSGFVWRVVRNKWSEFERVFFGFDIEKILLMPDEMLEKKAQDPAIIRNYTKVKTIRDNALMIDTVRREHGSFGQFVANWPSEDIIGLWAYLKKHGSRLGGNTGAYALRALGKDTFIISNDVSAYFKQHKLVEGGITSKTNLNIIQSSFNQWQQQTGFSLQKLSQILSSSVGDNHRQAD